MASLKKKFSPKSERNEYLVIPKMNIINLVTSFMYLELEVTNPSPEKRCEQIVNEMENWGNMVGEKLG
jgi:hypothetical protein